MRMVDLIAKKRDGQALTTEEINFIVEGYTNGDIPDYQVSSLAMAIFFQDMNDQERADLTMAMVNSGDTIDLSAIEGVKVDKHSTGGVGDTTTLVLGPLVAALGVPVAKMSGRGLGHTGGTIDKLEAVPGFHVEIENDEFMRLVNENKIAVIGQSGNLTPADKKLYALRDVTATVNSIPLIASSIMSKKIAAGADAIVLDVKTGAGAFMKTDEDAKRLAEAMVRIGNNVGRNTMAVISDMSQPLGEAIGNALEVQEAIDTLQGKGPKDLEELCLTLGSQMVYLAGQASSLEDAREKLIEVMNNGKALESFKTFLSAQGGDASVVDDPSKLPQAQFKIEVEAKEDGYVSEIVADEIGTAAMLLGAGRATKESEIDLAVGLMLRKKVGDSVKKGDSLVTIYANRENVEDVKAKIYENMKISKEHVDAPTLVHGIVTK
ncbi:MULTISPECIES: pyrimidine-nucleoside phosphorylase [Bacillus]|jgi:pyrimidine-nucleoside phosphorylase|uniref:Pyrimidine-nucleoside phosphorylase n=1 Tax=Bacillus toyonensis TaxID=155322 RepID=A0A1X3MN12_9BACI|nr:MULTISPECIES: pyrimidine-nucleoside phosphorylase [Bacillus]EEL32971.1 Pyrimidine-nucleoside phosphorylase [Bacillus cereus Rock3-28]EEL59541.2 2,5-didehydrogluconate reductase [Bacillus cereus Rock4-18]EJR66285.1 pyrimidine-nucleoside phosphorylase [Bacillus cereus VD115]EOP22346.1 pyrimidine-nucleoside phosphorylase [Bacillus cereus VD131]KNH39767.1 thymidine phosphorylase [Bacillus thuringiensis]KXY19677.1 thymidine phosphorylase [Bacillus cereus]MDH8703105.1 pyrimidine-nucleoside phos